MTKKSVTEGINRFLGYKESRPVMPFTSYVNGRSTVNQRVGNSETKYNGFGDMSAIGKGNESKGTFYQLNTTGDEGENAKVEGPQRFLGYNPAQAVLPLMSFLDRLRTEENEEDMEPIEQGFKIIFLSPSEDDDDILSGGLADDIPTDEFDLEQILKGLGVEREHTNNPQIALEITKDHLAEDDEYYDFLEDMESRMGLNESSSKDTVVDPFGSVYKKFADTIDKDREKGYNWRKDAQIHQFEFKEPKGRGKDLEEDYNIRDYVEKHQKPKKF